MIIIILLILLTLYIAFTENYDLPIFVSSRGFTTTHKPYDYYDSLRQDMVFETK